MRIGNVIIDTDNMTYDEVQAIMTELRGIRDRKGKARDCKIRLQNAIEVSKENGFTYCNQYTGEILKADDWDVYDEMHECIHGVEVNP